MLRVKFIYWPNYYQNQWQVKSGAAYLPDDFNFAAEIPKKIFMECM